MKNNRKSNEVDVTYRNRKEILKKHIFTFFIGSIFILLSKYNKDKIYRGAEYDTAKGWDDCRRCRPLQATAFLFHRHKGSGARPMKKRK